MSTYRVNHDYRGPVGHSYTVLEAGSEVDLDDDTARWLEKDSPGLLSKPRGKPKTKATQPGEGEAS